jgi:DNA-binding NtrC family response regulator
MENREPPVRFVRDPIYRDAASFEMIGSSEIYRAMEQEIRLVAGWDELVLITGERGSGKEVAARALHLWSRRRDRPFVPIFITAISESMLADELFGHKRGSFTGAEHERAGKFAAAQGGTVLLDEIGDLSAVSQTALLRVIETKEITPVGEDLSRKVDVRILAATNQNLPALIEQGRFRVDLYDRLRVLEIEVPPLRCCREDIPVLASHFLKGCCLPGACPAGKPHPEFCRNQPMASCATPEFYQGLLRSDWPGNIRELRNFIISSRVKHPREVLNAAHVATLVSTSARATLFMTRPPESDLPVRAMLRLRIEKALSSAGYNVSAAAKELDMPRSTLRDYMRSRGIKAG